MTRQFRRSADGSISLGMVATTPSFGGVTDAISRVARMLSGLRSPCTMCRRSHAASADSSCCAAARASAGASVSKRRDDDPSSSSVVAAAGGASVRSGAAPSTRAMTRATESLCSGASTHATSRVTCGCPASCASAHASRGAVPSAVYGVRRRGWILIAAIVGSGTWLSDPPNDADAMDSDIEPRSRGVAHGDAVKEPHCKP
mmetsp:Transcript_21017/g.65331  ORF Transcript_21017/g.65331 Transcript_21017/m.65331 type:complete len:202 (-) Transcript_21017:5-610(-)